MELRCKRCEKTSKRPAMQTTREIIFLVNFKDSFVKRMYTHVTSPPMTAVSRVDFRLQTPIVSGEMNNATAVESAPNQPADGFVKKEE